MIAGHIDVTVDREWRVHLPATLRSFFGAHLRIARAEGVPWYLRPESTKLDPQTAAFPSPDLSVPPDVPPPQIVALDENGFVVIPRKLRLGRFLLPFQARLIGVGLFAELWPISAWPAEVDEAGDLPPELASMPRFRRKR